MQLPALSSSLVAPKAALPSTSSRPLIPGDRVELGGPQPTSPGTYNRVAGLKARIQAEPPPNHDRRDLLIGVAAVGLAVAAVATAGLPVLVGAAIGPFAIGMADFVLGENMSIVPTEACGSFQSFMAETAARGITLGALGGTAYHFLRPLF